MSSKVSLCIRVVQQSVVVVKDQIFGTDYSSTPFALERDRSLCIQGQCPGASLWRPEPYSRGTDALTLDWQQELGCACAFPPFAPIGRVLRQRSARRSRFLGASDTSTARSTVVFGPVSRLCCSSPVSPESFSELLLNHHGNIYPLVTANVVCLCAWPGSGQSAQVRTFQRLLPITYTGGRERSVLMTVFG